MAAFVAFRLVPGPCVDDSMEGVYLRLKVTSSDYVAPGRSSKVFDVANVPLKLNDNVIPLTGFPEEHDIRDMFDAKCYPNCNLDDVFVAAVRLLPNGTPDPLGVAEKLRAEFSLHATDKAIIGCAKTYYYLSNYAGPGHSAF
jgi:hypothetical protein